VPFISSLAQILEWHRREDKVEWWEYFRLNAMAEEDLLDERAGIAGLLFERRVETTKRGVKGGELEPWISSRDRRHPSLSTPSPHRAQRRHHTGSSSFSAATA
jgi:hypothetical protein